MKKRAKFSGAYHENQEFFLLLPIITHFGIISVLLGYKWREFLVAGISILVFLVFYYLKIKNIIELLEVYRKHPSSARETEVIKVEYQLSNYSSSILSNIYITDHFTGSQKQSLVFMIEKNIKTNSRETITEEILLDGGMGKKVFKSLHIYVSDPLGLFKFKSIHSKESIIQVWPKLEKLPEFQFSKNMDTIHFGENDIRVKGDSTNFYGTKEYQHGDPVKRINWKLTLKANKVIVNQFEKSVNSHLTIFMNLDKSIHMGRGRLSTLEYLKDLSLAIAYQQITNGNEVQLITNTHYVKTGTGQKHINFLERVICDLEAIEGKDSDEEYILKSIELIPESSSIALIIPIMPNNIFEKDMQRIERLLIQGHEVKAFLINGISIIANEILFGSENSLKGIEAASKKRVDYWKKRLASLGGQVYLIEVNDKTTYFKKALEQMRELCR